MSMDFKYKPSDYNSLSPYLVVNGAQELMDLMIELFHGKELRRYEVPGRIMHAEVLIDDSVIMVADASDEFPRTYSFTPFVCTRCGQNL